MPELWLRKVFPKIVFVTFVATLKAGAVTHTMVKGISHVHEAVVNFNVDLL